MAKKPTYLPTKTDSKKTGSKKTAPKKPLHTKDVSKKPLLSIDAECSWEVGPIDIPKDHVFSNKVDEIQSILNAYIKIIPKKRPQLAQFTIDITVLNKDGNLVVNFTFLDIEYFSINIAKHTTGNIYINRKFQQFSHGGGKYISLTDWYASFLSVCNCIYTDISALFNE
jgi:hypothetical protein